MNAKLTPARRLALDAAACGEGWAPFGPAEVRACRWLRDAGLICCSGAPDRPSHYVATDAGVEALRAPFVNCKVAAVAVARWRHANPALRAEVIGWVYARCRGGGIAVRIGLTRRGHELREAAGRDRKSPVLPEGLDRELIRGR